MSTNGNHPVYGASNIQHMPSPYRNMAYLHESWFHEPLDDTDLRPSTWWEPWPSVAFFEQLWHESHRRVRHAIRALRGEECRW